VQQKSFKKGRKWPLDTRKCSNRKNKRINLKMFIIQDMQWKLKTIQFQMESLD